MSSRSFIATVSAAAAVVLLLTGCVAVAPPPPTEADFRAYSDELLTLMAEESGKPLDTIDFDGYWDENQATMTRVAETHCKNLATKTKDELTSQAELSIAFLRDQGNSRELALVSQVNFAKAAASHVCPQHSKASSALLAYLTVQLVLER